MGDLKTMSIQSYRSISPTCKTYTKTLTVQSSQCHLGHLVQMWPLQHSFADLHKVPAQLRLDLRICLKPASPGTGLGIGFGAGFWGMKSINWNGIYWKNHWNLFEWQEG